MRSRRRSRAERSKYRDIIGEVSSRSGEERVWVRIGPRIWEGLVESFGLIFALTLIVGLVTTSIGALADFWPLIAVGAVALGLWLILLVGYVVVRLLQRRGS